jgi:hypothetical protein
LACQEEVPDSSFRNSFNRDFNPAVAAAGLIITVALQVLKAIICCRQHTVAQQVFQERLIHIMYASPNGTTCSGVCNVSKANILFLWIGNNDVLGLQQRWRWNRLHLLQVWLVGFDATYDLLVNTLTSEG